ncbi:Leucine Rich repeats (2 copies) [Rosistilla ulvae]|uniref:Leucine Rich repeats (2 copies) n=1 Tax=Rosistilla ulvae TaxID=1930277 RepID=A0A517M5C1_9BACT|nr:leucine-rich repeat domain-containing protein [Rosistilla ulvae]QDS90058.1 Leucine Rich repeats (2 copies) [Rosistilla ulvae]
MVQAYSPTRFSIPSWPAWVQMIVACFAGSLAGGYMAAKVAVSRSDESIRQQMEMRSIDRFVSLGGEVLRDGDKLSSVGMPVLQGLGFYTIRSANDVRQAILYGGTLPGITQLHFAPFGVNRVGAGVTDGDVLRFANRNFKNVEYLDLSNCRIEDASVIQPMVNLKRLRLANNPLTKNGVESLNLLDSVVELWIGWPDRTISPDSMYRSAELRKTLVKALTEMDKLQKVHLYDDIQLTQSEKTQLGQLELVKAYMN